MDCAVVTPFRPGGARALSRGRTACGHVGHRLTPPEPTREEWEDISSRCERYQFEMLRSTRSPIERTDPNCGFDGTWKSLSQLYQTHDKSKFKKLRYQVQVDYARRLRVIEETIGELLVSRTTWLDLMRWHEEFAAPRRRPSKKRPARLMLKILKQIRALRQAGTAKQWLRQGRRIMPGSGRAAHLREAADANAKNTLTYPQVVIYCEEAHGEGFHSITLAQAIMFEWYAAERTLIGEWCQDVGSQA
jgi:hypothetical protein